MEERNGGRSLTYKNPSVGESRLVRLFVDANSHFNVSYMVTLGPGQKTPWHLFRINAQTGYGNYAGHAPMLRAIYRDFVVQSWDHPYPAIRAIQFGQ